MHNKLPQEAIRVLIDAKTHLSDRYNVSFDINDIDAAINLRNMAQELNNDTLQEYYVNFIHEMQNNIQHDAWSELTVDI